MSAQPAIPVGSLPQTGDSQAPLDRFQWTPQPAAEALVRKLVDRFIASCPAAAHLAERMREETGTRFIDWIDHIAEPSSSTLRQQLEQAGFVERPAPGAPDCFVQDKGMFPPVVLTTDETSRIAIKVESVADFQATWTATGTVLLEYENPIEGQPLSPVRKCRVAGGSNQLWVFERHGHRGFDLPAGTAESARLSLVHLENLRRRRRDFSKDDDGFAHLERLVSAAVNDLGVDRACDLFFATEREYWQRRNRAAQVQKARQDRLGLGWANHDHHTYRSSRGQFSRLIALFEKLGFHCRERFYAGAWAGWGAQVLEQPQAGIVIFADVDLSPDELFGDFAHDPLPPRQQLGTVGLWCALHGEAILQAGMHHLECQFDFDALKSQLENEANIRTMKPFTNFPYLRQAFTEGERWPVREERIAHLLANGQIDEQQAAQFRKEGAIGSHLENLERNQGFKGFNQQGVSEIIKLTDPRRHLSPTPQSNADANGHP